MVIKYDMSVSDMNKTHQKIRTSLKRSHLYHSQLLYRVFTVEDDIENRIRQVLERGTDRISDNILGGIRDGIYNLSAENDTRLTIRGRPLKQSEYLWLARENELAQQIYDASVGELFVSVYDPTKVTLCTRNLFCYEFNDKENAHNALIALIHVHYV